MRGGHQGVDCRASSLITPPNFGSVGGSCSPLMLVVALGEPGTPVICCAMAGTTPRAINAATEMETVRVGIFMTLTY